MNGLPRSNFVQKIEQEGDRATFSAGFQLLAAGIPATPTDLIQLLGSNSKIIRLSHMQIAADANAAGILAFYLYKRTTPNTGGVVATINSISHDVEDGNASAVLQNYTTLPTPLGTGQIFRASSLALPAATSTGYPFFPLVWDFGIRNGKMPTLRSANESICLNLGGQAVPAGLALWVDLEWTEDLV